MSGGMLSCGVLFSDGEACWMYWMQRSTALMTLQHSKSYTISWRPLQKSSIYVDIVIGHMNLRRDVDYMEKFLILPY